MSQSVFAVDHGENQFSLHPTRGLAIKAAVDTGEVFRFRGRVSPGAWIRPPALGSPSRVWDAYRRWFRTTPF